MERFDIYIRRFGPGQEPAAERLARVFGLPVERARELVASLPRVVKRGVPEEQLERYVHTLGEIGAEYDLRPSPIAPTQVIAVGRPSAAESQARDEDGTTLMLPPPREQPAPAPRFAGTVALGAPLSPEPAQWAEPASGLATADTLRERAEVLVEGAAPLPRASSSTWVEGRSSAPPPRGPNDTLVESRPPGSRVSPSVSPSAPPLPPPAVPMYSPPPAAFGGEPEQRAPDARVMQVHAPTVRSFNTLTEAVAPVTSETFRGQDPWALAPASPPVPTADAVDAAAGPPPWSRARDWTQPQGSPPAATPEPEPAPAPVAAPAPLPLAVAPAPAASAPPLSEAWNAIEPASSAELGPRGAPWSSRPAAIAHAGLESASELQLFGREEYAALAASAGADFERGSSPSGRRGQPLAVTPPGMWEGRPVRASQRPPPAAVPPPGSLQTALRPSTRASALRLPVPEPEVEVPAWLRWALRVGLGAALFVIVGALRQCRAVDDDVEEALAKWEVRPSASPGAGDDALAAPGAEPSHAPLGPVALDWLRSDLNQVSNGDKDRVRGLAQRFTDAGALGVYVGTISDSGMIKIAGELLVVLPTDPTRRAAVLAVHDGFLRATFGGFAPPSDPKSNVLRVTL